MSTQRPAVVVDPSLAIPWVVEEVHTPPARALLLHWEQAGVQRLSPGLFAVEAATALLRCANRGAIEADAAPRFLAGLLGAVSIRPVDDTLAPRALTIAQTLGLTKAYDSLYLALAEAEGVEYWTGDQKYHRAARADFPFVRFVGDSPT